MNSTECIFCKIAAGEVQADVVDSDEHTVVFRDVNPKAPTHLLAVPRAHVARLSDADAETIGRVGAAAVRAARKEGLLDGGYRVVVNDGAGAGQSVWHLHFHVLGGRALGWPPG